MVDVTSIPFDQIWKESKQDKARIMLTVAMSLADVHKVGVVHGDLDPGNILISRSAGGNLVTKLIDFTDSFFANDPPDTIMSKDFWWSPEVALYSKASDQVPNPYKKFISTKADVFSLGIVFHQYCSKNGAAPICKAPQPWQEFSLGRTPQIDPAIDPDFADLIRSMLEIEPDKRPSMADVHHTLLDILKGNQRKPVEQRPQPPVQPAPEPVKRERITTPIPPTAQRTVTASQPAAGQKELTPGMLVKSAVQLNPRKVKIVFENGKEQIMDLKLAILQKYVLED
jgi:serine/threonine protein kinase